MRVDEFNLQTSRLVVTLTDRLTSGLRMKRICEDKQKRKNDGKAGVDTSNNTQEKVQIQKRLIKIKNKSQRHTDIR